MASTRTPQSKPTPPEITFYILGKRVPSGTLSKPIMDEVLAAAKRDMPGDFVPTTYEASKAYLDEELSKPDSGGQFRNLYREMCMIIVVDIPDDQEISLINHTLGICSQLSRGTMLVLPTMDNPPTAFGTPENQTSSKLVNTKSSEPARATIVMTYFSKTT